MKPIIVAVFAALSASHAPACELTSTKIVFPNRMGTHTAWYCKATDQEKKQALESMRKFACIPDKLKAHGKPELREEATDVVPVSYTKIEAEKAGPILEVRLVLEEKKVNIDETAEETESMGLRALATGRRVVALPPPSQNPGGHIPQPAVIGVEFDLSEPERYLRDCPLTGCNERYFYLCGKPK